MNEAALQVAGLLQKTVLATCTGLSLHENDDAIGVGAFGHVVHPPAIGGFSEFLIINEKEDWFQAGGGAARNNGFFQPGPARVPGFRAWGFV